jgi:hypothetical protein
MGEEGEARRTEQLLFPIGEIVTALGNVGIETLEDVLVDLSK